MKIHAACAMLLVSFPCHGQEPGASLSGTVLDQSGAVIQRTFVFLESETDSSRRYLTRTDAQGIYRLSELPAGVYWLWFKQNGFREFVFKAVQLAKGEEKSIPPVTLIVVNNGCSGGPPFDARAFSDMRLLPFGRHAGNLVGTVVEHSKVPPAGAAPTPFAVPNLPTSYTPVADADVSLICDGDRVCSKIRTDPRGGSYSKESLPANTALLIGRYFFTLSLSALWKFDRTWS